MVQKYPKEFENRNIEVNSKTISSELVSSTRNILAETQSELKKGKIQNSHSHCIDAMIVFYLAHAKIMGHKHRQKENLGTLDPIFSFDEVYLNKSNINHLSKKKTFITSSKKEQGSYTLFDSTIYSEHYEHIKKGQLKDVALEQLIEHKVLYRQSKKKKFYLTSADELVENEVCKIDIKLMSDVLYKLFNSTDKIALSQLKFLDKLRYSTSRKEIENIFFDENKTALLEFNKIKNIPKYSQKLYKAVYKKLVEAKLFKTVDSKNILDFEKLNDVLKNMFSSKQNIEHKEERKRGKKRHKYTLPITGSPKFRIKRGESWQVLGSKDITTKNYKYLPKIKFKIS